MRNDIRVYNFYDETPLVSIREQAKKYFDKKFSNIHADVDLTDVDIKLEQIKNSLTFKALEEKIDDAKGGIVEAIEDAKPCLCHLATKEDVCKAKCAVIKEVRENKQEIIDHIDEKFVDLNEQIKNKE